MFAQQCWHADIFRWSIFRNRASSWRFYDRDWRTDWSKENGVIVRNLSNSSGYALRVTVNELSYVELFAFSVREAIRKFFGCEVIVGAAQRREIIFDDFASRFRGSIFPGFLVSGRFTVFRSTSIRFSSRNMPGASASCQLLRRWITIFKYSTFFVRKYGDGRCQPHPRCPDIYTYIYIYRRDLRCREPCSRETL